MIRNGIKTAVLQSEDVEIDLQRIKNNFKDQVSTIVSADDSIAINIESDKATVSLDDSRLYLHIPLSSSTTVEPTTINEHYDYANTNSLSPSQQQLAPRTFKLFEHTVKRRLIAMSTSAFSFIFLYKSNRHGK